MNLDDIQEKVFIEYVKNGYLGSWTALKFYDFFIRGVKTQKTFDAKDINILQIKLDIAEVGLFNTEVSEALEVLRTGIGNLDEELADIAIRVLNFASRKNIDMTEAILKKHEYNMLRLKLHNKKA